jgi:hypothetical protein
MTPFAPRLALAALFFLLSTAVSPALEITSISPSTAAVGAPVLVAGGPFDGDTQVLIGEQVVRPTTQAARELSFTVPELPAGEYRLTVRGGEQTTKQSFVLRIVEPRPEILTLDPPRVDLCGSGDERRITVTGRAFAAGARLFVDEARLPAERRSSTRLDFELPDLPAGMHRVEIVNPDDLRSLPFAVMIDGLPEIVSVTTGADRVVSYDLIVRGRNFPPQADLLVNGLPVNSALSATGKRGAGRDTVTFVDCRTLIYTRFPVNREPTPLTLAVVNPNGQGSAPFQITTP